MRKMNISINSEEGYMLYVLLLNSINSLERDNLKHKDVIRLLDGCKSEYAKQTLNNEICQMKNNNKKIELYFGIKHKLETLVDDFIEDIDPNDYDLNDTSCRIKWLDNLEEQDVTIRATEYKDDPDDDQIFFYGMRRNELIAAAKSGISIDGEWIIVEVY